jgi:transcriptional regulator with XRE-family HTH domain
MKEHSSFGDYMRQLREAKGWTQGELSAKADVSRPSINEIETGVTPNPRRGTLDKLAQALGVDPLALWELAPKKSKKVKIAPTSTPIMWSQKEGDENERGFEIASLPAAVQQYIRSIERDVEDRAVRETRLLEILGKWPGNRTNAASDNDNVLLVDFVNHPVERVPQVNGLVRYDKPRPSCKVFQLPLAS